MLPIKISKYQQQIIWEKIIVDWLVCNNNFNKYNLLNLHCWDLAKLAQEAWFILKTCNIDVNTIQGYFNSQEINIFLEWVNSYQLICKNFNYIDEWSYDLINNICYIVNNFNNKIINLSNINNLNNNLFKIECYNFIEELNQASRWAFNPKIHGNIGIIILDLENNYLQVDYIFSNYINYAKLNPDDYIYDLIIDNSLYNNPAIKIMLLILQIANCYLNNQKIKYEDFSKLLRTKFISGGFQELDARFHVDYLLRQKVDAKFSWEYIKLCLLDANADIINIFINLCNNFEKVFINYNLKKAINLNTDGTYILRDCKFWTVFIKEILQAFSWLTEKINQHHQLLLDYLQIALNEYLKLQDFLSLHTFEDCYKNIIKILQYLELNDQFLQKTVNLKNKQITDKHIKIISLSKAIYFQEQFDYLWICGLNENNYFYQNKFNPFLSSNLQKIYIENFHYVEDLNLFSIKCLNYLKSHTKKQFICSYSLYIDNNLVNPSMIIDKLPNGKNIIFSNNDLQDIKILQLEEIFKFKSNNLIEKYYDENTNSYLSNTFHGVGFLKSQIACPFQANAKFRLQAYKLQIPSLYLSKALKSEILHKTLADFWNKYKFSWEAKSLTKSEVIKELNYFAIQNLLYVNKFKYKNLNKILIYLEAKRIANLCGNFIINYDLTRSDFKLLQVENKSIVKLKEFLITIKIDRIDELKTGEWLIIDYKTGNISPNPFNLDNYINLNIDDPQLFIYSLYNDNNYNNVKAILLANIRTEKIEFMGLIDSQVNFADNNAIQNKLLVIDDWQNYVDQIYAKLYSLIIDFKKGIASVKPKNSNITCRLCDLQKFCRIL